MPNEKSNIKSLEIHTRSDSEDEKLSAGESDSENEPLYTRNYWEPSTSTSSSAQRSESSGSSSESEDESNIFEDADDSTGEASKSKRPKLQGVFIKSEDIDCTIDNNQDTTAKKNKKTDLLWSFRDLQPKIHNFDSTYSGCKADLNDKSSILECFQTFFSEEFVAFIVEETNKFHTYTVQNTTSTVHSRLNYWKDTTVKEMYCFLAVTLLMSRIKKLSYAEYWSKDRLIKTDVFGEIMARDRYLLLLQMLHFNDNNMTHSGDRLIKIRMLIDKLRTSFQQSFRPSQNLCIGESISLLKGKLFFKQYAPCKRNRSDIKTFVLCDCNTRYVLDFIVQFKSFRNVANQEGIGKPGEIIMKLLEPYLDKGHTLFVSKSFTSPALFTLLHNRGTNACGTVSETQKGMPTMTEKLKKAEITYRSTDTLLALKWCYRKEIWMLTTCHSAEFIEIGKTQNQAGIQKPKCIIDYNRLMGTTDRTDFSETVDSVTRSLKWYKKFFLHILDISVWNACILYNMMTGLKMPIAKFHLALIKEILKKYHEERRRSSIGRRANEIDFPLRLNGKHFPATYMAQTGSRKNPSRKCVVCSKNHKRRESRYYCRVCDVGLCIAPCFEIYHTKLTY